MANIETYFNATTTELQNALVQNQITPLQALTLGYMKWYSELKKIAVLLGSAPSELVTAVIRHFHGTNGPFSDQYRVGDPSLGAEIDPSRDPFSHKLIMDHSHGAPSAVKTLMANPAIQGHDLTAFFSQYASDANQFMSTVFGNAKIPQNLTFPQEWNFSTLSTLSLSEQLSVLELFKKFYLDQLNYRSVLDVVLKVSEPEMLTSLGEFASAFNITLRLDKSDQLQLPTDFFNPTTIDALTGSELVRFCSTLQQNTTETNSTRLITATFSPLTSISSLFLIDKQPFKDLTAKTTSILAGCQVGLTTKLNNAVELDPRSLSMYPSSWAVQLCDAHGDNATFSTACSRFRNETTSFKQLISKIPSQPNPQTTSPLNQHTDTSRNVNPDSERHFYDLRLLFTTTLLYATVNRSLESISRVLRKKEHAIVEKALARHESLSPAERESFRYNAWWNRNSIMTRREALSFWSYAAPDALVNASKDFISVYGLLCLDSYYAIGANLGVGVGLSAAAKYTPSVARYVGNTFYRQAEVLFSFSYVKKASSFMTALMEKITPSIITNTSSKLSIMLYDQLKNLGQRELFYAYVMLLSFASANDSFSRTQKLESSLVFLSATSLVDTVFNLIQGAIDYREAIPAVENTLQVQIHPQSEHRSGSAIVDDPKLELEEIDRKEDLAIAMKTAAVPVNKNVPRSPNSPGGIMSSFCSFFRCGKRPTVEADQEETLENASRL